MSIGNDGEGSSCLNSGLLRVLYESVSEEAVVVLDTLGRVIGWNSKVGQMTGCPADRAMGRHVSWFWPEWDGFDGWVGERRTIRASLRFDDAPALRADVTAATLPDQTGAPAGFTLVIRPQEPAESSQADKNRALRLAQLEILRMPLACVVYDADSRITSWNAAAERIFGFSESEAIGKSPYDLLIPPSALEHVEAIERRIRNGDMSAHSFNENLTKDGQTIYCRWTNTPLEDADGRMMGCLSMAEDVTDQVRAEQALRASEQLFRSVFEEALDAFLLADDDGRYTGANQAAGEVFGLEPAALIGRKIDEFLEPEVDFHFAWAEFLHGGHVRGPLRIVRPDGLIREVEFNSVANVIPGRHLSVIRDVTDWRLASRAMQESERLAGSILDSLPSLIAVLDQDGMILRVNQSWRTIAEENGVMASAAEGANYLAVCDSVSGDDLKTAASIAAGIRDVLGGRRSDFALEYPCIISGRDLWFKAMVSPFKGEGPPRVIVSHLDVTDRKSTEESLKRHADRLEILRSIDRAILAARSPEEIAGIILGHLAGLMPCWWWSIETFDVDTGQARLLASHGGSKLSERKEVEPTSPVKVSSRWSQGEADPVEPAPRSAPRYLVRIPLKYDGRMIGSLDLGSDLPISSTGDQLDVVREVVNQLAIAIGQALLYEELDSNKQRLEKVSRRLIHAEEDERRRIARELHDEIGQGLTALKIHMQVACQEIDNPTRSQPRLEEGMSLVDRTLRQIRSISLDLRPSLLDDFGLVAALRSLINTQAKLGGFTTHLSVVADDPEFRLGPELETACFRVAQESLTNIVRYAGAKHVEVVLRRGMRDLELSVVDDGCGFDPAIALDRASSGESFGLIGMRERVTLLGGRIEFQSKLGQGTSVFVRFPLAPDEHLAPEGPDETDPPFAR